MGSHFSERIGNKMKKLNNGWMVPDDDQRVTRLLEHDQFMHDPEYESKFMQAVITHLPNKRTFVDVGANVGIWSLPMTKHFSNVVAYEPSKQNIECIKANIPSGIELREKAVADFNGEAEFSQAEKNCGDGKLVRNGLHLTPNIYVVEVVKLDEEELIDVDMIKIDTQGWEWDVVKGMKNIIEKYKPWVMIEINEDVDLCCSFMENYGYETVSLKSKRNFLWAPKDGHNSPEDKSILNRYLGPGPYALRFGG
jgi:FkbM family methyltransferase